MKFKLLTSLDILSNDRDVFVSVGPGVLVPKPDGVTQFVNDHSKFVTILPDGDRLRTVALHPDERATPENRRREWRRLIKTCLIGSTKFHCGPSFQVYAHPWLSSILPWDLPAWFIREYNVVRVDDWISLQECKAGIILPVSHGLLKYCSLWSWNKEIDGIENLWYVIYCDIKR